MSRVVRGDDTPPPPTSLIWDAPCRSCSRTRRRTSSALSAILAAPVCFHVAYRPAGRARNVGQRPQVAMAAGRGDHRAARIDARPGREALVDRLLERERGAAQVPDRGEAAHQRALRLGAGGEKDVAELGRKQGRDRQRGENRVPVRVDQSGHHDPAAAIDRPRAFRTRRAPGGEGFDPAAFDHESKPTAQCVGLPVEKQKVREDDRRRRI